MNYFWVLDLGVIFVYFGVMFVEGWGWLVLSLNWIGYEKVKYLYLVIIE